MTETPANSQSDARVSTEVVDNILIIHMVRHEKRNAVDAAMTLALDAALNRLEDDSNLWIAVLSGGPDMFCAGTDMGATSGPPTERGGIYGIVGRTRTKPLIAAIEGFAYGGGFEIAMACDLVVCADNARLGLPEVKRGLVASSGALVRASRVLPLNVAKHLLMTGADLAVEDAERYGMVTSVCAPGNALATAVELGQQINANSPVSVQQALQAVDKITGADDERAWEISHAARRVVMASSDSEEGVAAFFEKRAPRWTGK